MRLFLSVTVLLLSFYTCKAYASTRIEADDKSAVILAYNRIDEHNYPQTSLRLSDFLTHIETLIQGNYKIVSLGSIIKNIKESKNVSGKTIAITFEGAYKSAFTQAIPILLEKKIPFTVFYASDKADSNSGEYMSWKDLRYLKRYKFVEFGMLPASYGRVIENTHEENKRLLNKAKIKYRDFFNKEPELFSYPFGQHNQNYKTYIKNQGFSAAFGLQSGVAYSGMDFFNIPRFTLTDGFGGIERFQTLINTYPIPAIDIEPQNHVLNEKEPLFGFSVPKSNASILKNTSCFISGQGKAILHHIGTQRIEIRPPHPLEDGRVRINCTANTGGKDEPKWRWFGMLYTLDTQEYLNSKTSQQDELPLPQE